MIKVRFSDRVKIDLLFEAWCVKNQASKSTQTLLAFLEQKGWLNSDKILDDLKHMTVD